MRSSAQAFIAAAILDAEFSPLVELLYRRLPPVAKGWVHRHFAKSFVGLAQGRGGEAVWTLELAGKPLRMPLRPEELAVDWDNLLSLLGAEIEVKAEYRALLNGPKDRRPEVFVDCGASYGTHSLLLGAHGVRIVAFEPNPECHSTYRLLTQQLAARPALHPYALGEHRGQATLRYPAHETWIGRIGSPAAGSECSANSERDWRSTPVDVVPLDEFRAAIPEGRLLVKIDVEGAELAVLRGATELIRQRQPLIIVESWRGPERAALFDFFAQMGYAIRPLAKPMRRAAHAINFLAVKSGHAAAQG